MSMTNFTTDQSALIALKSSIILENPHNLLSNNWTTSSSICTWVGITCGTRHQRVKVLNLTMMGFSAIIPPQMGNLSFLVNLDLAGNNFHGHLPQELAMLRRLKLINLSYNMFSGEIPTWIMGGLPKLQHLDLRRNNFSGFIQLFPDNLTNLETLVWNDNLVEGKIPPQIGFLPPNIGYGLPNIEFLFLSYVNLEGEIPSSISNSSKLIKVGMMNNALMGDIPNEIGNLKNLQWLDLTGNHLTSENSTRDVSILSSLTKCKKLKRLDLSSNPLSGKLPSSVGNFSSSIENIHLDNCKITGSIPEEIGNVSGLIDLSLGGNDFSGPIPTIVKELQNLQKLDLGGNSLDNSIPDELCRLKHLSDLILSNNKLSGLVPSCFGTITSLRSLYLDSNNLTSTIPSTLWNLRDILHLNLSSNVFNGSLPLLDIQKLRTITYLDLSRNQISGSIPNAIVQPCLIKKTNRRSPIKLIVLKFILPITVSTILLLSCAITLQYKAKKPSDSAEKELSTIRVPRRISYYELLHATNRFDESNFLGEGSFGSVFKGILSNGLIIAVKVFKFDLEATPRSFDVECEALRNIRHRNLIKIISSCSNNVDFRALVMEFMQNGILEMWLYAHNYCLDFLQRLNIMIDVASALEYLHHGYSVPVVHCDLKPNNILLDKDMVAHVADFGIAKLLDEGQSRTYTNTLGTLGYIAPGNDPIIS
ncbi:Receptor-like protein kinase [Quillaja saponaria]|uniref:Receptor-like protein kinase n=1 Tax=Quillaja saponaria TaxID=32244 RepID=A0AAD7PL05_QUISA|nr:Receptor-like protein kinase [Quillaja saponaria]